MKKTVLSLVGATLISASLMPPVSANVTAETLREKEIIEALSVPINHDEYLVIEEELLDHIEPKSKYTFDGGFTVFESVSDGPNYTWEHASTHKYDDVAHSTIKNKVPEYMVVGLSASAKKRGEST